MSVTIRNMVDGDWSAVERVYAAGIAGGSATFASETPTKQDFFATRLAELSFVAELDGSVLGWAAATPTSDRDVYRGVIEHSVYVDPHATGRGLGSALLESLIERARGLGFWMLQASILPENTGSLRIHEKAGFRRVGRRERIGFMTFGPHAGTWRDTVLIEKRL
ncbi:GNAT family N-acetyltransferase [Brevibacterium aurantiacum]|uniref:N-acetyltransferase n=1 Tax=Brevibacterium aurantiacum TaxID=273384 RepID=A0A556CH77_BREAU|nr:GNAT family N-acetyltransferase [Brevibacterium aurantiacum]TSI16791.1 N-acetyltransferase [Brevibacterium aurantiacum]